MAELHRRTGQSGSRKRRRGTGQGGGWTSGSTPSPGRVSRPTGSSRGGGPAPRRHALTLTANECRACIPERPDLRSTRSSPSYLPPSRFLSLYVAPWVGLFKASRASSAEAEAKVPLHHRRGGLGGSGEIDHRARAQGPSGALAEHAQGRPRHYGRLPSAECGADPSRTDGAQGLSRSYDTGALLRFLADIKAGKRNVEAPVYSHLVYDVMPGETSSSTGPTSSSSKASTSCSRRACPGTDKRSCSCRTISTSRSISTPTRRICSAGTSTASRSCAHRLPRPAVLFRRYAEISEARRSPRPTACGTDQP